MTSMIKLFEIAKSRADLTDDELRELSDYDADFQLVLLADVVSAIGCLVSADGDTKLASTRAGNFQNANDVPDLLWFIASNIRNVQEKLFVSQAAELLLQERNEAAAKQPAGAAS